MNFKTLSIVGAALGLSACSGMHAPDGYVEAPAVKTYVSKLVAPAMLKSNASVAACELLPQAVIEQVSVLFEDGMLYTYEAPRGKDNFELIAQSSSAQRKSTPAGHRPNFGCLGYFSGVFTFEESGTYRIKIKDEALATYVSADFLANNRFDESEQVRVSRIVKVMNLAHIEHKKNIPIESTWGIKS